jgi:hypothetical protein
VITLYTPFMQSLRRYGIFAIAALVTGASVAAYLGGIPGFLRVAEADKALHFLLFGLLSFFWVLRWGDGCWRLGALRLPKAILVPLALATIEEALQTLSWRRAADPLDLLCDSLGMVTFWWLATRFAAPARAAGAGDR